jgi:diacylglycerol kinase family enzyme
VRWRTAAIVVNLNRRQVEVAVDGEVEVLQPPLRYRCLPGQLNVLVP